jgi:hypothetical protein
MTFLVILFPSLVLVESKDEGSNLTEIFIKETVQQFRKSALNYSFKKATANFSSKMWFSRLGSWFSGSGSGFSGTRTGVLRVRIEVLRQQDPSLKKLKI